MKARQAGFTPGAIAVHPAAGSTVILDAVFWPDIDPLASDGDERFLLIDLPGAEILDSEGGCGTRSPETARLLKRLRRIEALPPADQRAVLKLVDTMLDTRRRSAPTPRSTKRKAS